LCINQWIIGNYWPTRRRFEQFRVEAVHTGITRDFIAAGKPVFFINKGRISLEARWNRLADFCASRCPRKASRQGPHTNRLFEVALVRAVVTGVQGNAA
jgi:hypothetical protein